MLDDIYNYLQLTDDLATAGQPSAVQIAEIAAAGYQVIINLAMARAEDALDAESFPVDEAGLVRSLGLEYVHIPVIWTQPELQNLRDFFQVMEANQGKKVFVHCIANMRVSTFVMLYRILRLGWPYEKALQDVMEFWLPNETWQSFIDAALSAAP